MDSIFSIDDEDLDFSDDENFLNIDLSKQDSNKQPANNETLKGKSLQGENNSIDHTRLSYQSNNKVQSRHNNNNFDENQNTKNTTDIRPVIAADLLNNVKDFSDINNLESFFEEDIDDPIFSQCRLEDTTKSKSSNSTAGFEWKKSTTNAQNVIQNNLPLCPLKSEFKSKNGSTCIEESVQSSAITFSFNLNETQNTISSSPSKSLFQNLAFCSPHKVTYGESEVFPSPGVFSQRHLFQNKAFNRDEDVSISPDSNSTFKSMQNNKPLNVNNKSTSPVVVKSNVFKNNVFATPSMVDGTSTQDLFSNRPTPVLKSANIPNSVNKQRSVNTPPPYQAPSDRQTPSKILIKSYQKRTNDTNQTPFDGLFHSDQMPCNSKFEKTPTFIDRGSSKRSQNKQMYKQSGGCVSRVGSESSGLTPIRTSASLQNQPRTVTPFTSHHKQPLEACIKRSVLKRKSLECSRKTPVKTSKFPGPAGRLPKLNNIQQLNALKSPELLTNKRPLTPKASPCQLVIDNDFPMSLFEECISEFKRIYPTNEPQCIASIIKSAASNNLENGKVRLMCVLIKLFTISGNSGKLVLYDSSGQIYATTHKLVLDEFEPELRSGTGLILRDISVYSPTPKKHYVNITPINIVNIFPADLNETIAQTQLTQVLEKENLLGGKKSGNQVGQRLNGIIKDVTNTSLISNDSSFNNADNMLDYFSGEI